MDWNGKILYLDFGTNRRTDRQAVASLLWNGTVYFVLSNTWIVFLHRRSWSKHGYVSTLRDFDREKMILSSTRCASWKYDSISPCSEFCIRVYNECSSATHLAWLLDSLPCDYLVNEGQGNCFAGPKHDKLGIKWSLFGCLFVCLLGCLFVCFVQCVDLCTNVGCVTYLWI